MCRRLFKHLILVLWLVSGRSIPAITTELGSYLIPLKFAASSRETDADARGIQYMQKAGYDPRALLTFLQKMQPKEEADVNRVLAMFQTHPPTAERIRLAQERIATATTTNHLNAAAAEFQKIKATILQTSIKE